MKKSQVGVEFIYFVGIAVVLLLIYLVLSSNYLSFASSRKDDLLTQNLLEEIRNEINLGGRVEDGYSKTINIPLTINNKPYNLNINGREIYISFQGSDYSRLLSTDVANSPINFTSGNTYTITKQNNEVRIS